jgi:hypothetical protein
MIFVDAVEVVVVAVAVVVVASASPVVGRFLYATFRWSPRSACA